MSKVERGELRRIGLHVDLADEAAVAPHDVGDAVDAQQRRRHHPVLQRAALHQVAARAVDRAVVDPPIGVASGLSSNSTPSSRSTAALEDLLAREQRIDAVVEGQRDVESPEQRQVAQVRARRAVQPALDRAVRT